MRVSTSSTGDGPLGAVAVGAVVAEVEEVQVLTAMAVDGTGDAELRSAAATAVRSVQVVVVDTLLLDDDAVGVADVLDGVEDLLGDESRLLALVERVLSEQPAGVLGLAQHPGHSRAAIQHAGGGRGRRQLGAGRAWTPAAGAGNGYLAAAPQCGETRLCAQAARLAPRQRPRGASAACRAFGYLQRIAERQLRQAEAVLAQEHHERM